MKIQSIKTNQSLCSSNPEVAVVGLRDGIDRPTDKPCVTPPLLTHILGQRFLWLIGLYHTCDTRQAESCGQPLQWPPALAQDFMEGTQTFQYQPRSDSSRDSQLRRKYKDSYE